METLRSGDQVRAGRTGRLDTAFRIFAGALPRHAAIDRGGTQSSLAWRDDRNRMPRAHPAGRRGSRRPLAARNGGGLAARQRRRRSHPGQGWRPSAVAAGGYRTDDPRRGGVLSTVPKNRAPDLIRGGSRFSDKIAFRQKTGWLEPAGLN